MNRVCGTAFDAVLTRGGVPCQIQSMRVISKDEYAQALREREAARKARRAARKAH